MPSMFSIRIQVDDLVALPCNRGHSPPDFIEQEYQWIEERILSALAYNRDPGEEEQ